MAVFKPLTDPSQTFKDIICALLSAHKSTISAHHWTANFHFMSDSFKYLAMQLARKFEVSALSFYTLTS